MRRWWLLAVAVALGVMFSRFLVEVAMAVDVEARVREWISAPGGWSAAGILVLLSVDILLPVPSSLVMVLSGALFGTVAGGLLSLLGSLVGNWVGFEIARAFGRRAALRFVGEGQVRRMTRVFERFGAATIVASRPLPILMETFSVVAGLAGVGRTSFFAASLAGTVPTVFAYAYAGALSLRTDAIFVAVVALIAVPAVFWMIFRFSFVRLDRAGSP
jgi:uncharacterized membrane protein YdjX (TVP38/TMEM64 family)